MVSERVVWVGTLLMVCGTAVCIRDVRRGKIKPNLVTWSLWAVVPMIALVAQLRDGVTAEAVLTLMVGVCPAAVAVAAIRKGCVGVTAFDVTCGLLAVVALILWGLTGSGEVAIVLAILADAFAAMPTIVRAYRNPRAENPFVFAMFVGSAAATLLAVRSWTVSSAAFAVYILVLYLALFALTRFSVRPQRRVAAGTGSFPLPRVSDAD